MKFSLTKPCKDCPFRKSVRFPLAPGCRQQIAESLMNDWNTFPCHKTVVASYDEEDKEDYSDNQNEQHCAGAMIVLMKDIGPNVPMRFAIRMGELDLDKLKNVDDVYDSLEEFAADEW